MVPVLNSNFQAILELFILNWKICLKPVMGRWGIRQMSNGWYTVLYWAFLKLYKCGEVFIAHYRQGNQLQGSCFLHSLYFCCLIVECRAYSPNLCAPPLRKSAIKWWPRRNTADCSAPIKKKKKNRKETTSLVSRDLARILRRIFSAEANWPSISLFN